MLKFLFPLLTAGVVLMIIVTLSSPDSVEDITPDLSGYGADAADGAIHLARRTSSSSRYGARAPGAIATFGDDGIRGASAVAFADDGVRMTRGIGSFADDALRLVARARRGLVGALFALFAGFGAASNRGSSGDID